MDQGLTTLNKVKSGQVSTNNGIITQHIFNAFVLTSVELKNIDIYIFIDDGKSMQTYASLK